jgi:hypothetical protein
VRRKALSSIYQEQKEYKTIKLIHLFVQESRLGDCTPGGQNFRSVPDIQDYTVRSSISVVGPFFITDSMPLFIAAAEE